MTDILPVSTCAAPRLSIDPGHANRTLGVLSRMLTLAEVWEMRPEVANPCRFVKKYPERKRERFLSDDEYRRLGAWAVPP